MKVCYLNYDGEPTLTAAKTKDTGGLNTIVYNLASRIARIKGNEAMVIFRGTGSRTITAAGFVTVEVSDDQFAVTKPVAENIVRAYAANVAPIVMRERPDVIHTSGAEAGFAMALLRSEGIRIPWVHTNYATLTVRRVVVDGVEPREALADPYAQREQLCLTGCDAVVALSETDKVETVKVFGLAGSKVTAVTPGIDTDIFKPDKMQPAGHLVVSAGRMSPIKDFPFLLRAFRHTSSMLNHQSQLIIIGGNQEERVVLGLPAIVKELGLSSQVKFLDGMPQAELARWFRKARVYAGCSRHETFGLLPVEARACGAPFVVRANSAYLDTCEDGFGGSFVDNTDEKEMGKRFAEILSLREREWRSLSEQAVESAKPFSWETAVAKNLLVYQQVLEGGMVRF